MRYYISITITILSVLLLLGTAQAQSNDSLLYFSSELDVGYEYIWDKIEYTALTFLSDEITEEHNISIKILKEIDKDYTTLEKEGEILVEGWGYTDTVYNYFLVSYDGNTMTKDMVIHPEDYNTNDTRIIIISVLYISSYIFPVEAVGPNGETNNQFDILANKSLDFQIVDDGEVVIMTHNTDGPIGREIIEYKYEYITGLLLQSNISTYGENGLISQYITTLTNNIETEIVSETQTIQTPTNATEIGFLPFPSTWVSIIGIIAVFAINKRKKRFDKILN